MFRRIWGDNRVIVLTAESPSISYAWPTLFGLLHHQFYPPRFVDPHSNDNTHRPDTQNLTTFLYKPGKSLFQIRRKSAILAKGNGVNTVLTLHCGPYTLNLFTETDSQNVVYAVMDQAEARAVWSILEEPRPALAAFSGVDWNRELSPWPAPGVFRGAGDVGGGGPHPPDRRASA